MTQMIMESMEPAGEASPMGYSVFGNIFDVSHERGILAKKIDRKLWLKEIMERPQAVKKPLKQKCTPASMQSHTYPRRYSLPCMMTSVSSVKNLTAISGTNWRMIAHIEPNPTEMAIA